MSYDNGYKEGKLCIASDGYDEAACYFEMMTEMEDPVWSRSFAAGFLKALDEDCE